MQSRYIRLRYTAAGALAALAAAGAVAGTGALAAGSRVKAAERVQKVPVPQPASRQPFLAAVSQLVGRGTITAAQGGVLDGDIQTGRVDTDALAASGFTAAQLDAVQSALTGTKRALGRAAPPVPTAK